MRADVWAGLSNLVLTPECFDLGDGVSISQTYAHFMAPFMMAFAPAPPGKAHPAPWKNVDGSYSIDINAQLFIPGTCKPEYADPLSIPWWIMALMRLKIAPAAFLPVIASAPINAATPTQKGARIWPVEISLYRIMPNMESSHVVGIAELEWLKAHWEESLGLMTNEDFKSAIQAVDQSTWGFHIGLALVGVWGALERLFSPPNSELSFRVSANIAAYLEDPGKEREKCFANVKRLYSDRSKAAHGNSQASEIRSYQETLIIAKRALLKMVEARHVPTENELRERLFGT